MLYTVPHLWKNKKYHVSPSAYQQTFPHPAARGECPCAAGGKIMWNLNNINLLKPAGAAPKWEPTRAVSVVVVQS